MALTETARLLASLELQDKFTPVIRTVEGKIDSVGRKLDDIGTRAQGGIDKAKTRFGQLRQAASDSNLQIGAVGAALAGLENFVPPSIRPLVQGLEDINRIAPNGLPGIAGAALAGLKTITANTVTVVGKAIGGPALPGVGGTGNLLTAAVGATIITALAVPIGQELRKALGDFRPTESEAARQRADAATGHLAAIRENTAPKAPKTDSQLAQERMLALIEKNTSGSPEERQTARDQLAALLKVRDSVDQVTGAVKTNKPTVNISVPVTITNQSLGGTTTTVYSRYSTSVTGTGGSQI